MRLPILLAAVVAIAGCSRPVSPDSGFAQEVAGRVAGPAQMCISTDPTQALRVLDRATLAYGWGRTIYVNHLGSPCPGITPTSTLIVERQATQACRGDRVRGLEAGAVIAGPTCLLGEWVPYRKP
jgi:hypothetical protein